MSDDEDGQLGGHGGNDGEMQLPKATVFRAIKDALPDGVRCSSETGNLVMECCMELLRMVSDEATQLCAQEGKSTIGADHIYRSVESLGFKDEWKSSLDKALQDYKESVKRRPKMSKNPTLTSGLSMEELIRQQKEMLAEAKARRAALTAMGGAGGGAKLSNPAWVSGAGKGSGDGGGGAAKVDGEERKGGGGAETDGTTDKGGKKDNGKEKAGNDKRQAGESAGGEVSAKRGRRKT